jgi:putative transposase
LLSYRGIDVSYETVRRWSVKFGLAYAMTLRKTHPRADVRWHLDEVFVSINGKSMYLWRAVDCEGEVLDVLIQSRRNKQAALNLMRKLLKSQGFCPTAVVTDKLPSYGAALSDLGMKARHVTGGQSNNRAVNAHLPIRQRERACSVSSQPVQRNDFSQHMPRSTIPSASNAIWSQEERFANSELRR